jgi:cbb3-type cytochrome oxidase maturation protein
MDILYLLIPLSLVLVFVIAVFFWWSLRSNQYDDLDGPGYRILMDDDRGDDHPDHKKIHGLSGSAEITGI